MSHLLSRLPHTIFLATLCYFMLFLRYGRKGIYTWCLLQTALADTCAIFAPSILTFCILRFLAGLTTINIMANSFNLGKSVIWDYHCAFTFSRLWNCHLSKIVSFSFSSIWMDRAQITVYRCNADPVFLQRWADAPRRTGFCHSRLVHATSGYVSTFVCPRITVQVGTTTRGAMVEADWEFLTLEFCLVTALTMSSGAHSPFAKKRRMLHWGR